MTIRLNDYTDKEKAGALLIQMANASMTGDLIGRYKGFMIYSDSKKLNSEIKLVRNYEYKLTLNNGYKKANIDLLDDCLKKCNDILNNMNEMLLSLNEKREQIEKSYKLPFEHKETLENLLKEKLEFEKEFNDENKTFVQMGDEENIEERQLLSGNEIDEEIEM